MFKHLLDNGIEKPKSRHFYLFIKLLSASLLIACLVILGGCSSIVSQHHAKQTHSSSLASFLYPNKQTKIDTSDRIPKINLPVKIGIAFLPSKNWRGNLDTSNQYRLLNKVKSGFSQHPFIDEISIIPSSYLGHHNVKGGSGFDTLEQVARMHDVDVIALVSYDQLTQTLQNNASLLYWTIVGMYVIPGNENTIQTFVDTAVFDVRSRKMLMRAPGISKLTKRSTAIGVDHVMRNKSLEGFNLAFEDMIINLDEELLRFKTKVKQGKSITVSNQQGYSGAGSMDTVLFIYLLMLCSISLLKRKYSFGK